MQALIIGKPNTGKSLFAINFAAYLGLKEMRLEVADGEGRRRRQRLPLDEARLQLVSRLAHKTVHLQPLTVDVAWGRSKRTLTLMDTVGLTDTVHPDPAIRRAMAVTLERLTKADVILHVIDASAVHVRRPQTLGPVDDAIAHCAGLWGSYAILANKLDVPVAHEGLKWIKERYRTVPIIGISALTHKGFREVKTFVLHCSP